MAPEDGRLRLGRLLGAAAFELGAETGLDGLGLGRVLEQPQGQLGHLLDTFGELPPRSISIASRVLPTPPGPVNVTSRLVPSSEQTCSIASVRPISSVSCAGTLVRGPVDGRGSETASRSGSCLRMAW